MRWNHTVISGLFLGGLALAFLLGIPTYVHVISVYADEASPRAFPYLTAGVMLLLCTYLVATEWYRLRKAPRSSGAGQAQDAKTSSGDTPESVRDVRHVAVAYVVVCLGVLSISVLGFYAATTAILLGLMLVMGVRDAKVLLFTTCIWPLFLYLVFAKGFALQFPLGRVF